MMAMKIRRLVLPLLCAGLVSACHAADWSSPRTDKEAPRPLSPLEMDLAEASFRYLFQHNESVQQGHAHVYCLAWGRHGKQPTVWRNPPPTLLRRLGDVGTPVKGYAACQVSDKSTVYDGAPDHPGIVFFLESMVCSTPQQCEVISGYHEATQSGAGHTLTLVKRQTWVVVNDKRDWIS